MTRLGYQIPNFTYPGIDAAGLFGELLKQAQAAEAAGFDRLLLMDHFYQLPGIGDPDAFMLECYTALAGLAQHTCLLYTSPSPRDQRGSRMPSSA